MLHTHRTFPMRARLGAAILMALASLSVLAASNAHATTTSLPTLAQVYADVQASVGTTKAPNPNTTVPPLTVMINDSRYASLSPQRAGCWANSVFVALPANVNTFCAYGDTVATRTILLTGDSQAGMWLPALDALGKQLSWKIIFLAMRECGPWGSPNGANFLIFKNVSAANCRTRNSAVANWATVNHPAVVMLSGRGYPKGWNIDVKPVLSTLVTEMSQEVNALRPSGARLIVIGPIPRYDTQTAVQDPTNCLDFAAPFVDCQQSPTKLMPSVEVAAENFQASVNHFKIAKVFGLMCTLQKCTIVVQDAGVTHLVFFDGAHINRVYSVWISQALATIVQPLLP